MAPVYPVTTLPESEFNDIPLSNMRRVIASRLSESKQQIPHYQLTMSVRMDKLLAYVVLKAPLLTIYLSRLRKALNNTLPPESKLSVNDLIVKSAAATLMRVPEVNAQWHGDFIRQFKHADISVATATPSGLITPILTKADTKGLLSISQAIKDLVARARKNELKPHEFQGGTFTISNLGMYGITSFNAIINPPQSAILAVGTTERVLIPSSTDDGQAYEVANMLQATLSCDHRVVDGALGAQWMQAWKKIVEQPLELLL